MIKATATKKEPLSTGIAILSLKKEIKRIGDLLEQHLTKKET